MLDLYKRHIHYLRISVTDRCNLRCLYCMPEEGVPLIPHDQILSLEEIRDIVKVAISLGIDKIRLTGGEPLVRKGIVDLVAMIASFEGLRDLAMTTNGILLSAFAADLKAAGLMRVNVSLDTMDPVRYAEITRGGRIEDVLEGLAAAKAAGLSPIKLNAVVPFNAGPLAAGDVARFGEEQGFEVRFIHQMDLHAGEFTVVEGGEGGDCAHCSRLRLSSRGVIYPCLFNDIGFDVRTLGAREAILAAVRGKPKCGVPGSGNTFYGLGG